jgi:hypothetical protein
MLVKRLGWIVGAALLLGAFSTFSADQPPSVMAGALTRDGIGARAIALGGAFTAVADDATAGYYNPSGLAHVPGLSVGGMYESKFDPSLGTSFQYASGTYFLDGVHLGAGLTWVRRSDTGILTQDGSFDTSESLVMLSGGYEVLGPLESEGGRGLAIGASAKLYAARGYAEARASGIGADLGALVTLPLGAWEAALGLRSSDILGSRIRWSGTPNEIVEVVPWGQHLGIALRHPELGASAVVDVSLFFGQPELNSVRIGAEYVLWAIAIRAGLKDGTPVFGVGVAPFDWLQVDFAVVLHGAMGSSLVASMEVNF